MKKVAIYVRSSKDRKDVACEAQERQLREVVSKNKEAVCRVFRDKGLSSTRDVRPEFDEMYSIATSKNSPFSKIYCLDTSRFGRDHHETQAILYELRRKHGIDVVFANMPNTGTYLDPAFESIFQAFDYIHSQQSKTKGVASQKQNILNGWRAGGPPPYGYLLEKVELGKHRTGDTITKTRLVPNPETCDIARKIFERRAKLESRRDIIDDFYRQGIPSPKGLDKWAISTIKSMEDNVDTYLGHTLFFRHNERVKTRGKSDGFVGGKKWRPKEEWLKTENTHEPLITPEIADRIREIKQRGLRDTPYKRRVYPLSGLMKCDLCGTKYVGDNGFYRCNSKIKPGVKCPNNNIAQNTAEEAVFLFLKEHIFNIKNVEAFADRVRKRLHTDQTETKSLEKRLANIQRQLDNVMKLYRLDTIDIDDIEAELVPLQKKKKAVSENIEKIKSTQGAYDVSDAEILDVISRLDKEFRHADPNIRKRVCMTLFEEIRILPKQGNPWKWERLLEIKGVQMPLTRVSVVIPGGIKPPLPT